MEEKVEVLDWDDLAFFRSVYADSGWTPCADFYRIRTPFRMDSQRVIRGGKRPSPHAFINEECDFVQAALAQCAAHDAAQSSAEADDNNKRARDLVLNEPACAAVRHRDASSLGEQRLAADARVAGAEEPCCCTNASERVVRVGVRERHCLVPPRAQFIQADVAVVRHLIHRAATFDCIVLDPPWPNRSVRRKHTYSTDTLDTLRDLDLPALLAEDGVVYVWLTNSATVRAWADQLRTQWALHQVGEVFWVKTTTGGEPVQPFRRDHKLPYEKAVCWARAAAPVRRLLLRATPHASHSRKPPIAHALRPRAPWRRGLELFGRYLLPDCLTLGDQCLKFQDLYFFRQTPATS